MTKENMVGGVTIKFLSRFAIASIICAFAAIPLTSIATELTATPPFSAEDPLQVKVGLLVVDVREINDAEQLFEGTLIVVLSWKDPRLKTDSSRPRFFAGNEIWTPRFQITNEIFARERFRDLIEVASDGSAFLIQRFAGRFSLRLDLRRFPFDAQTIGVRVGFPDFKPEQLTALPDDKTSGLIGDFTVADWTVHRFRSRQSSIEISGKPALSRASVTFEFDAQRRTGFYLWKVIFPLVIIVCMSWTVFWIDPENAGTQISVATSSILTLIAFRFILGNLLPRIAYLTDLDYFILGSTVFVFLALIEAVMTGSLAQRGRIEQARRLDFVSRIAFPIAYLVSVFVLFSEKSWFA